MVRSTITEELLRQAGMLPDQPGVYLYKDDKDEVIYVGKAKNLRKRVVSYFSKNPDRPKVKFMIRHMTQISHIVVDNESEALLLENNLIKKYQPRYNAMLKDDKSYPSICVKKEAFPRVFLTRKIIRDGSTYYGPFANLRMAKTALDFIKLLYPLRTCNLLLSQPLIASGKYKVCLDYHIGNCKGPCQNLQSAEDYKQQLAAIHDILKGNVQGVTQRIKSHINDLATDYKFEEAHQYQQRLELLSNYQSKSTVVNPSITNVEVYTILVESKYAYINFLRITHGSITQVHTLEIKKRLQENKSELLLLGITAIREKFLAHEQLTEEILCPFELKYKIDGLRAKVPKRGDKLKLMYLSMKNARYYRLEQLGKREKLNSSQRIARLLKVMQEDLGLKNMPLHIECFDNSNLQGTFPVSACVVFKSAKPAKGDYRIFNVKTVEGPDDFATMREVIYRRYSRMLAESVNLPQLIIVDGGKGQLSAAFEVLIQLGITDKVDIIGIAKRLEEIYKPGDPYPLYLDKNSESLKIIQQARDEAHRFGITAHRNRRSKSMVVSQLEEIKGVGDKTLESIYIQLQTLDNIKEATLDVLMRIVGRSKALLVYEYFHPSAQEESSVT